MSPLPSTTTYPLEDLVVAKGDQVKPAEIAPLGQRFAGTVVGIVGSMDHPGHSSGYVVVEGADGFCTTAWHRYLQRVDS